METPGHLGPEMDTLRVFFVIHLSISLRTHVGKGESNTSGAASPLHNGSISNSHSEKNKKIDPAGRATGSRRKGGWNINNKAFF